jgi:hypothetical protein
MGKIGVCFLFLDDTVVPQSLAMSNFDYYLFVFSSICCRYCPSVFILKPGEHLHINKGRLHAFRKMTFDELPENDCHAQLRKNMILELKAQNIHRPPLCISVAFDW